ncbi:MAG: bifunctional hydroxymethylpyrimidine kinase/phosphomethylpyrimidine kinase [Anaeromyxobacter sp.]
MKRAPRVLVVAGLNPSGGAGLLADAEALGAVGALPWTVAAALTAQGPGGARGFVATSPAFLEAQLDALLGGRERARAVKTGMLADGGLVRALAARLGERALARLPLVVDPVLAASSGAPLVGEPAGGRRVRCWRRCWRGRGWSRPTCPSWRRSPGCPWTTTLRRSARRAPCRRGRCW